VKSDEKLIKTKNDKNKDELLGPLMSSVVEVRQAVLHVVVDIRLARVLPAVVAGVAEVAVLLPYLHHHAVRAVRRLLEDTRGEAALARGILHFHYVRQESR